MNNTHQRLFALTEHLLQQMANNGGAISFQDCMQAALYQPGLGYYQREEVFGEQGDFTTSTAMGKWLALGFVESIKKSWEALGKPQNWTLIEQGGGTGILLTNVLTTLQDIGLTPSHVFAVETSDSLRNRQQQLYEAHHLDVHQVSTLDDITPVETAIYFSNELPDAFPVRSFIWQGKSLIERGVGWDGQAFIWQNLSEINASAHQIPESIQQLWPEDYISEFNPHLLAWQQSLSKLFQRGVVLTVDYGYSQKEYYRPQRIGGTLMGHHKHQAVDDVLKLSPGVCDITAHVDFSALKSIGESLGLTAYAYTTQGAWLAQADMVQQRIQALAENPTNDTIAEMTFAKRLMLPNGMGESFKILVQGKALSDASCLHIPAFDRLHTL